MRPIIGITTTIDTRPDTGRSYHSVYAPNAFAIERAGGLPVLIPAGLDELTLRALYERVDGLLIPGGGDINPACYGAEPHPKTTLINDQRDSTEFTVIRWAYAEDRPLFGICRGNQAVNVALGGTLTQDIPSLIPTTLIHDTGPDKPQVLSHDVEIMADSRLAQIAGSLRLPVNSLHHQCAQQVAPGLVVTARAADGIIEGLEAPDRYFFHSVQWHPEDLVANDPAMHRLFESLVSAARARMESRTLTTA